MNRLDRANLLDTNQKKVNTSEVERDVVLSIILTFKLMSTLVTFRRFRASLFYARSQLLVLWEKSVHFAEKTQANETSGYIGAAIIGVFLPNSGSTLEE